MRPRCIRGLFVARLFVRKESAVWACGIEKLYLRPVEGPQLFADTRVLRSTPGNVEAKKEKKGHER